MIETCKECNGTGEVGYAVDISDYCPCSVCEGYGEVEVFDFAEGRVFIDH